MSRPHILIIGAGGLFGSRLTKLLARRRQFHLSLGGRRERKAARTLAEALGFDPEGNHSFVALDRKTLTADTLLRLGCDAVVDCAGPFQDSSATVIEAAIGAGCHYVDLADGRDFVSSISRFDAAARAAQVAVISGASTTPALSNAVIDVLTQGWHAVDAIDVAIVPGNRTPKGKSVVSGILSWVGRKLWMFRDGDWNTARGWTETEWVKIEGLKRRRAALANVPDLDILVERFKPRIRASVKAGMELGVLHGLIGLAGLPVRWRLFQSAQVFTSLGRWIAQRLDRFGTQSGGMLVEVSGLDHAQEGRLSRWSLRAHEGDGPFVPAVPAAATLDALLSGRLTFRGARHAAGLVPFDQMRVWFEGLAIETSISHYRKEVPLYKRVLGPKFADLPAVTRRLHQGRPAIVAHGEAIVEGPANAAAGLVARLFGMPAANPRVDLKVIIEAREGREYWTRFFDGRPLRSIMQRSKKGLLEERFGPVTIRMRLEARPDGIDMVRSGGSMFGIPLPPFLLPRIKAQERVDPNARHAFDVEIRLPLLGRLVAYRGWLAV